ncbi:MAG: 16S rRNA (uracil(1498)-N(3))-methyltransferase [Sedimentisphaerales bacterium]|jgi:16S rRNA (uracil1498-N3)-methyltransferase|nr:16S rRNA (uracil(1498)-N(3))-methyltransferase [Sedimentisphaerales bacterium]HNY77581.1 16S rRNA (uracil(1498)-N(3))-methyltransferase [Sedimentisphaerales bacterium]HOC61914.1 16S rRNA (uracil(1498)-N(3))-methyltransferase [Sedimentisphaerales bacterium]HOH63756.1 16S rRNA (uracil(1498)-N(3))-methyltransferase [Sedimentisphaerales bacterium]HPY51541.1 16S rRNA (uracil(1498)-N(3))-methyltransferase [Sedimentisphaerales bacterium]
MSANRFFVSESGFEGDLVRLSAEQAHQVCHVLRLKAGDEIVVLDGAGGEFDVTLTTADKREAVGRIVARRQATGEPTVRITLFQGLLAREKFEWVLQKGTEVGVSRFVPIQTERTLLRARQIDPKKLDRWQRIVTEAAEQSHRGRVPQIEPAITFAQALSRVGEFDRALIAATSGQARTLTEALAPSGGPVASVAILIGPEGGFSDAETAQACESGGIPVSLGPRILRTETAAIVAPALVLHVLGQTPS